MKINDILRAAWPAHRSTRLFPGAVGAILIVCAGCGGNKGDSSRKDAEALFRQQLELTNLFIDSMNHASDSTALLNLYDRFAERMTDCNLSYSPDTDLSILEGENEMLAEMLDSMMRLKARPVSTKNTKISQVWWYMPVIPATREAEAGYHRGHGFLPGGCRRSQHQGWQPL